MAIKATNRIRIGTGAGYSGDRIDPAIQLIKKGSLDYIVFECLAERTIAIAQKDKLRDPGKGFDNLLKTRMERVLPLCVEKGTKVITNMGAANPEAAAKEIKRIAETLEIRNLKIAYITGDSVYDQIEKFMDFKILETGNLLRSIKDKIVSANAYIGASGIVEALKAGSDIIVCGRVADPSLFLGPMMYEFDWDPKNYDLIGKGILAGHLLECGAQIVGGYYADPGYKEVPDLWQVGFPIGEVTEDGSITVTKLDDAGGIINRDTCIEQILYEIHDPEAYITPDGVADFSRVIVDDLGNNCVKICNATGRAPTGLLKVSIGYQDCYIGEGEISYGGPGAIERAELAGEIVRKRLDFLEIPLDEVRMDLIGVSSLYGKELSEKLLIDRKCFPEVRLRVAARTYEKKFAESIGYEIESLYLNGPAGGGGVRTAVREILSVASIFIPENLVEIKVDYEEFENEKIA